MRIIAKRDAQTCTLFVEDNGVGLPIGFELNISSNLGLQIVRTLTQNELQGELQIVSKDAGTSASVSFPI
jgi:two-component sensor histidine kinase